MLKSMKAGGADIENFRLGKNSDRDDVYQEEKRSIWHYIIGVLLTFSVISIIVLFTLVGKVNSDKNVRIRAKSFFVAVFPLTTYIPTSAFLVLPRSCDFCLYRPDFQSGRWQSCVPCCGWICAERSGHLHL